MSTATEIRGLLIEATRTQSKRDPHNATGMRTIAAYEYGGGANIATSLHEEMSGINPQAVGQRRWIDGADRLVVGVAVRSTQAGTADTWTCYV